MLAHLKIHDCDDQELLERGSSVAVPGWAARAEGLITEAPRGRKYHLLPNMESKTPKTEESVIFI